MNWTQFAKDHWQFDREITDCIVEKVVPSRQVIFYYARMERQWKFGSYIVVSKYHTTLEKAMAWIEENIEEFEKL